jgi:dethiobiotin synthetase
MRGIFITGTDTGAGKTRVAVALLGGLRAGGLQAVGMKPVAAGIDPGAAANADVVALATADGVPAALADRNPYAFAAAIAPHLAARDAGITIDLGVIEAAYRRLAARVDVVVVEGAGGALVPLGEGIDMLDVPVRLAMPVLLVVGMRLGCLNHAALTLHAIRTRGLVLAGWIANRIDPRMERADDNVAELAAMLGAPAAADCPWNAAATFSRTTLDSLNLIDLSSGARGPFL